MLNIAYIYSWRTRKLFITSFRYATPLITLVKDVRVLEMEWSTPETTNELYRSRAWRQRYVTCRLQGLFAFRGMVRQLELPLVFLLTPIKQVCRTWYVAIKDYILKGNLR